MQYNNNVYQNYLENEVLVADPVKLVRMLYQGALDAVAAARACLGAGDIAGRSRQISKATSILNELSSGLDHSKGGEISRSLAELYDYVVKRLNDANFRQIDEPLAEVYGLLTTLMEAWENCKTQAVENTAGDYVPADTAEYHPVSCTA